MINLNWIGDIPVGRALLLAALLSALSLWLYRRQLRNRDLGFSGWVLASLRSVAVALVVLTLAEPAMEMQTRQGELARLSFLVDASRSMSIEEPGLDTSPRSLPSASSDRFSRAVALLTGEYGYLAALHNEFDTRVLRFDQQLGGELWSSDSDRAADSPELAYDWGPTVWSEATALGDALANSLNPTGSGQEAAQAVPAPSETLVVLSDGRHNYGRDPLMVAEQLARAGVQIYTIGMGRTSDQSELALQQFSVPQRVLRSDTLHGTLTLEQRLAAGTPITLRVEHAAQIVWQTSSAATDATHLDIAFSVPVERLYQSAMRDYPMGTEITHVPLKLTARLIVEGDLDSPANNSLEAYSLIAAQKSRLLIVDGRSRWETRYLKNAFTRDPGWQVDTSILSSLSATPQAVRNSNADKSNDVRGEPSAKTVSDNLPTTVDELSEYDLVILGEVEATVMADAFWSALRGYVELAGGGLIIIDGAREFLRSPQLEILQRLSPVTWLDGSRPTGHVVGNAVGTTGRSGGHRTPLTLRPQLTSVGQRLEALRLDAGQDAANLQRWSTLPGLQFVSRVQPLPGAEVLIEAVHEADNTPLLITRRYGAGRVLFAASDETWRWRYEVAEQIHSRLWLQLARWARKAPLSLQTEFVSLDTGAGSYLVEQSIPLRCQLRQADGSPATGVTATAQITTNDRVVTTVVLNEDTLAGNYSADLNGLPVGDYQVSVAAPGYTSDALALRARFSVVAPPNQEMREVTCNVDLLQAIADSSGGVYLPETSADRLVELLQPRVQGKMKTATTLLWQSYGWFAAIMLLLTGEWIMRKRLGLI